MHMTRQRLAAFLSLAAAATAQTDVDWKKLVTVPKLSLSEAATKALALAGSGVICQAELELDKGKLVYSIDVAQGEKTCALVLDVADGKELDRELEGEDHSAAVAGCKTTLVAAVAAALARTPGKAIAAAVHQREGKPWIDVTVFADAGGLVEVKVDGLTGGAQAGGDAAKGAQAQSRPFTDTFAVDRADLAATGRNPFFILEPGYALVLQGKEGGADVELVITVLPDTRKIDGVETRVVEERESKGGKLAEVSRNFFAISRRTNSVYYFGEEVDIYKDGKVASHEGAWTSGVGGARFGLFMPGEPLIGARYYQEVAPGVAMDRAEVLRLADTAEVPAGKYDHVLVTEESTPLESGKEEKFYAPGVGLVRENDLRLVKIVKP